ncbi:general stress protein CsbD [Emticicia sp. C21]|nr:general stress protein CsbD [Emticicia sp. C21]
MNREQLKEEWKVQKSKLLKKFSVLTEDDLFFREGHKDEMLERLQLILGKNKEELIMVFDAINQKQAKA